MAARSHIDLCLFVQIIEIDSSDLPIDLQSIVASRDSKAISLYLQNNKDLRLVNKFTEIHESIHTAQAITYPYLRVFGMHAFSQAYISFHEYSPRIINLFNLTEDDLALHLISTGNSEISGRYEIWIVDRDENRCITDLSISVRSEGNSQSVEGTKFLTINAIDLIENAASVIQYKIMNSNDFPLWSEYIRWCRRNPSNSSILEAAAKLFKGEQVLLDAFPSLCYASFCTNHPVGIFAYLLMRLEKSHRHDGNDPFFNQPEPRRWVELFDIYLSEYNFDDDNELSISKETIERFDPYWTSTLRLGGSADSGLPHPILGKLISEWGECERNDISYRYALSNPNGCIKMLQNVSILTSPVRILKFVLKDGSSFVTVDGDLSQLGLGMVQVPGRTITGVDLRAMFRDFMAIFGYARTFSQDLWDPSFRLCTHKACPHFERNLCNGWLHIPENFADCGFVNHMFNLADIHANISRNRERKSWTRWQKLKFRVRKALKIL